MIYWFTSATCQPCKRMAPAMQTLIDEGVRVEKIDVYDFPVEAERYGVYSVPTLVLKDGDTEVNRHVGALNEMGLRKFIA